MKMQGDSTTGAGHAGLVDALNEIFAPGKEHQKEQKQYDERVGRQPSKKSGSPLDFKDNAITLVVDPAKATDSQSEPAEASESLPAEDSAPTTGAAAEQVPTGKKERPHRNRKTAK